MKLSFTFKFQMQSDSEKGGKIYIDAHIYVYTGLPMVSAKKTRLKRLTFISLPTPTGTQQDFVAASIKRALLKKPHHTANPLAREQRGLKDGSINTYLTLASPSDT